MGRIIQHIPNFFSGFAPETGEYLTKAEFEEIPFVKGAMDFPNFDHFRQHPYYSEIPGKEHLLVAITIHQEWWVIGYMDQLLDYPNIKDYEHYKK